MRHPPSTPSKGSTPAPRAWVVLGATLAVLSGCGPRVVYVERGPQAYYQTAFPMHDASEQLRDAFRSLRHVVYSAEYQTYVFPPEEGLTEGDLVDASALDRASAKIDDVESKRGTAIVLARAGHRVALVTNDHVVRFPPIRINYFEQDRTLWPRSARRVASVSVRSREWGRLQGHPEVGDIRVLARDSANDLAIFEVRLPERSPVGRFVPLPAPPGDPRRLSWGSFVYVLGYPRGYAMVTRAIVSDPNRDQRGGFLTDGMWNEGISGGAILAVRGDGGGLEWIGITRAGAGSREVRLQPLEPDPPEEDFGILYEGPIFAEPAIRIQYGITFSVPMTAVRAFLDDHEVLLRRHGYDLRRF